MTLLASTVLLAELGSTVQCIMIQQNIMQKSSGLSMSLHCVNLCIMKRPLMAQRSTVVLAELITAVQRLVIKKITTHNCLNRSCLCTV
jgi:hypothetical protein